MSTNIFLVVSRSTAVLLEHHHVPLVLVDLVDGDLGGGVLLPGPAALQVTVVLVGMTRGQGQLRYKTGQVIVVGEGIA